VVGARPLAANTWSGLARTASLRHRPGAGVARLSIRTALSNDPSVEGLTVELHYEVYDGHPAVRKWWWSATAAAAG